jgi:hypothetical protein
MTRSRTATGDSLSRELERMIDRAPPPRPPQPARTNTQEAAEPAVKNMGRMRPIEIGGQQYTWAQLSQPEIRRQLLPQVEKLISEFKRDPARLAARGFTEADRKAAIAWTTGQYDNYSEGQLHTALGPLMMAEAQALDAATGDNMATNAPEIDGKTAFREVVKIASSQEGKIALRRRANGQSLDAAQAALIRRHDDLEAANNAQARSERRVIGGVSKATTTYVPSAIRELAKLPPVEQAHRSRELIAGIRNNKDHPFNLPAHLGHKQAVAEMRMLYDGQYMADTGEPVITDEK